MDVCAHGVLVIPRLLIYTRTVVCTCTEHVADGMLIDYL